MENMMHEIKADGAGGVDNQQQCSQQRLKIQSKMVTVLFAISDQATHVKRASYILSLLNAT